MIHMKRSKGVIIPFEYNYYLSIGIYSKLKEYQEKVRILHSKNQPGIHTFSNIISKEALTGENGLDIKDGFFIIRSLDSRLPLYLRLGISEDPFLRIGDVIYEVSRADNITPPDLTKGEYNFKSLSPILVRDFNDKKQFVNRSENIEKNLTLSSLWTLKNLFQLMDDEVGDFKIQVDSAKRKTVKISNTKTKESITTAYQVRGKISGSEKALQILYYRGLGSKVSLGLGCWEVE